MEKKFIDKFSSILFYFCILLFIISFDFAHNPPGGWYQQFLPNLNGRPISDITFLDSLIGFGVTPYTANDTAYIIKTTDGGNNWNIVLQGYTNTIGGFNRIQFVNQSTGYTCGNFLWKTTNGGLNWFGVNTSGIFPENMYILNEDTIWLTDANSLVGGVFRTTNGGTNWIRQYSSSNNPNKIYMFNSRIGFIANNNFGVSTKKTTDGGFNWFTVINEGFTDINFIDSLTGWKCWAPDSIKITTDGGLNWISQALPQAPNMIETLILQFSNVNKDTIWGVGGFVFYPGLGNRGIVYRTTNSGSNWLYQIPDTSIAIARYRHTDFYNHLKGWAYSGGPGIHTIVGGDSAFYPTSISQISSEVPTDFQLYQNYPNPFNPSTTIIFKVKSSKIVKLIIHDITGKEISVFINEKLNAGEYQYIFNASLLSSGVYFYSLIIEGKKVDTKKMILVR